MTFLQNQSYSNWVKLGKFDGWLTFFTPTYNRARFLDRVFSCINNQTDKRCVWIIVNDGSSDDTEYVAKALVLRDAFPILFISKENGGKHSAFKVALENTVTEFFACMDDDDIYNPESVSTFLKEWCLIKSQGLFQDIGAIRVLAKRSDGCIVSNVPVVMGERFDCTTLERIYIQHISQENWTCYRTEALVSVDIFPQGYWLSDKHSFFLEGIWQGRFARKYKCRYYSVCLREYRDDAGVSLIRAKKTRNHYMNMFINSKMILDEQLDFIRKKPILLMKTIFRVSILRKKLIIPFRDLLNNTSSRLLKLSYVIFLPISILSPFPKIE